MASSEDELRLARRARKVAIVMSCTMLLWLAAQWFGGRLGLPARYVFLFDFAALAAFVWAMAETIGIWRLRRKE